MKWENTIENIFKIEKKIKREGGGAKLTMDIDMQAVGVAIPVSNKNLAKRG